MSDWQPIETAPKDHVTSFDLWAHGNRLTDCMWGRPTYSNSKELCWIQLNASYDSNGPVDEEVRNPTHWMPLPEPPK